MLHSIETSNLINYNESTDTKECLLVHNDLLLTYTIIDLYIKLQTLVDIHTHTQIFVVRIIKLKFSIESLLYIIYLTYRTMTHA